MKRDQLKEAAEEISSDAEFYGLAVDPQAIIDLAERWAAAKRTEFLSVFHDRIRNGGSIEQETQDSYKVNWNVEELSELIEELREPPSVILEK